MSVSITDIYRLMPFKERLAELCADSIQLCQDDRIFELAHRKSQRAERLRHQFAGRRIERLLIGNNLAGLQYQHPEMAVEVLPKGFFNQQDPQTAGKARDKLAGAVVLLNNNDVGHDAGTDNFSDFYRSCEETLFVAWDWDNHHWLSMSIFLAAHSDLYVPSHNENMYLLSRFNALIAGPVFCSSVQWSRQYLCDHLPELLTAARSDSPLGMHIPYANFDYRNRVIATIGQQYSTVGFSSREFHQRSADDRFKEWCSHKSHWIAPVLNDVPIRIFDALITGGIPIVPESLRYLAPVRDIPLGHIEFYSASDVVSPQAVVERANRLFDMTGRDGMVQRHRYALDHHHGIQSFHQILDYLNTHYGLAGGTYSNDRGWNA